MKETWQEQFDEKFPAIECFDCTTEWGYLEIQREIKSFISKLLEEERERIIKEIGNMPEFRSWEWGDKILSTSYIDIEGKEVGEFKDRIIDLIQNK